jgi:hypothetical protein
MPLCKMWTYHSSPSQADLGQHSTHAANGNMMVSKVRYVEDYSEFLICKLSRRFCMLIFFELWAEKYPFVGKETQQCGDNTTFSFWHSPPVPHTRRYTDGERIFSQILPAAGLRSVDRNNKATLPLTRPGRTNKSYAKDLSPRIVKLPFVS